MSIWLISPSGDDDVGYRDHAPVASHQRPRHAVDHRRLRERGEWGPGGDDFLGDGFGAVHRRSRRRAGGGEEGGDHLLPLVDVGGAFRLGAADTSAGAAGPRAGRFLADLHNLLESPLRAAP